MTGMYQIKEVAEELRGEGFVTRPRKNLEVGKPLTPQTWQKICRNPVYGGLLCEK
jgi:hypothetical protein